jgi:chromosome segregation ATPase
LELANARLQSEREALELARQEAEETRKEAAALADALAAELDKAQADNAALREQLALSIAKQEQQQAIINQETAAAIESKHRVELAEVARAELKTRADQLSELLKDEQAAHLATQGRYQADTDRAKAEATELREALTAQISATTQANYKVETVKAEQSERKAETDTLRAALESVQAEKSKLEGMLTVYESIGGSSGKHQEVEPGPEKTQRISRKPKQQ